MAWKPGPVTFIGAQEEQDDTCRVERAEGQEMRSLALPSWEWCLNAGGSARKFTAVYNGYGNAAEIRGEADAGKIQFLPIAGILR